jgi:Protein of unknown function (DUF2738)
MSISRTEDPLSYNVENIRFSEPVEGSVTLPGGKKSSFFRLPIKTKKENGQEGDLIFVLERSSSFGISEYAEESGKYSVTLSIQLTDRDSPSERQRKTVQVFQDIAEAAKNHIVKNSKIFTKILGPGITKDQFRKMCPVKVPMTEDGEIDTTRSPTMNVKLLTSNKKKNNDADELENPVSSKPKIITSFYAEDSEDPDNPTPVDPLDYIGKRCFVTCAVKVDGVFVGGQIQVIQLKLYECNIKAIESKPRRLLAGFTSGNRPTPNMTTKIEDSFAEDPEMNDAPESSSSTLQASDNEDDTYKEEEHKPAPSVSQRKGKSKK